MFTACDAVTFFQKKVAFYASRVGKDLFRRLKVSINIPFNFELQQQQNINQSIKFGVFEGSALLFKTVNISINFIILMLRIRNKLEFLLSYYILF